MEKDKSLDALTRNILGKIKNSPNIVNTDNLEKYNDDIDVRSRASFNTGDNYQFEVGSNLESLLDNILDTNGADEGFVDWNESVARAYIENQVNAEVSKLIILNDCYDTYRTTLILTNALLHIITYSYILIYCICRCRKN